MTIDIHGEQPIADEENIIPLFQHESGDGDESQFVENANRPLVVIDKTGDKRFEADPGVDLFERIHAGDRIALQAMRNLYK